MTAIKLIVTGAKARAEVNGVLTSGMVGLPVTIEYDEAWKGLAKNLVCRCGRRYDPPEEDWTRIIANVDREAVVAHEVMEAGKYLYLGVEGYSADGRLVLPTTWAECGLIQQGAQADDTESADPTMPVWAQLEADVAQLKYGAVTDEKIARAVADYMEENPIEVPDAPAVPDGAVCYTPQELTEEQKTQARENIGAVTAEEVISELEEPGVDQGNLLEGAEWAAGILYESAVGAQTNNAEVYMVDPVAVSPNHQYVFTYRFPATYAKYGWYAIVEYNADGTCVKRTAVDFNMDGFSDYVVDGSVCTAEIDFVATSNTSAAALTMRTFINRDGTTDAEKAEQIVWAAENMELTLSGSYAGTRLLPRVTEDDNEKVAVVKDGVWTVGVPETVIPAAVNPNVKSVNHRGYNSVAPENTLAAYRLSKKMGFDIVECDVSFTSDGYAVLLHDTTVERTSDGTGTISELTFEYVRSLDFGSWKSADYAGEQIPTFAEFIALCRKLGLHPYIEIKTPVTQAQIGGLVETVKQYGMLDRVTWITSAGATYLEYIKNLHAGARLGLVCTAVSEGIINDAVGLKTDANEVFIDAVSEELTDEMINLCITNSIPVEVWDLWSAAQITAANGYISGFTTDTLIAGAALYSAGL